MMASVEEVIRLIEAAGDSPDVEELARAIVALDGEATKETRVLSASETR